MAVDGLVTLVSRRNQAETVERLIAAVTAHGAAVLACIDHAKAAAAVDMTLLPTEVDPLWQCARRHAADAGGPDDGPRSAAARAGVDGRRGRDPPRLLPTRNGWPQRHGAAAGHEGDAQGDARFSSAAVAADATG